MPQNVQRCLIAETSNIEILKFTSIFTKNNRKITIDFDDFTLEGVKQYYIYLEKAEYKPCALIDFYESLNFPQHVIYVNTLQQGNSLEKILTDRFYTCSCIYSGMSKEEIEIKLQEFNTGSSKALITNEIKFNSLGRIFLNYDFPIRDRDYLGRIGQSESKRLIRNKVCINFMTQTDFDRIKNIERKFKTFIRKMPIDLSSLVL